MKYLPLTEKRQGGQTGQNGYGLGHKADEAFLRKWIFLAKYTWWHLGLRTKHKSKGNPFLTFIWRTKARDHRFVITCSNTLHAILGCLWWHYYKVYCVVRTPFIVWWWFAESSNKCRKIVLQSLPSSRLKLRKEAINQSSFFMLWSVYVSSFTLPAEIHIIIGWTSTLYQMKAMRWRQS